MPTRGGRRRALTDKETNDFGISFFTRAAPARRRTFTSTSTLPVSSPRPPPAGLLTLHAPPLPQTLCNLRTLSRLARPRWRTLGTHSRRALSSASGAWVRGMIELMLNAHRPRATHPPPPPLPAALRRTRAAAAAAWRPCRRCGSARARLRALRRSAAAVSTRGSLRPGGWRGSLRPGGW